ncbi:MAG: hypothetical protein SF339_02350 [Blastocatellia bacterium]|nr:hypothetical protein [Blastocatellia bacterium]
MTHPYLHKSRPSEAQEQYFQQKEAELMARMETRRKQAHELKELAAETGIADEEILAILQELGYTRDTVSILHFVPLVQVAWASGSVTPKERQTALRLVEWRGIAPGSPAWRQLNEWLDVRPSEEFFLTTLRLIRHILDDETQLEGVGHRTDLISFCIRIATASGGFLGSGSNVSEGERGALDQIVEELTTRNPEAVRRIVEAM